MSAEHPADDAAASGDPRWRVERDRDDLGRPANARPRDRLGRPLPRDATPTAALEEFDPDGPDEALAIAVGLWDEQRFFEAHEVLERVWHVAPQEDRLFWQGVIQVAVGCCHHQRGNVAGAVALLRKAAEKLRAYPDVYYGVDVEQLRVFAEGAAAAVEDAGEIFEIGYLEFPAMDDGPWFSPDGSGVGDPEGPTSVEHVISSNGHRPSQGRT